MARVYVLGSSCRNPEGLYPRVHTHKQGVVEADSTPIDNPLAISASGSEIIGSLAGASFSWFIDIDQVYVCKNGKSQLTGFPGGIRTAVVNGAALGR